MADPTKAWHKAFDSGSKEMQNRLKKVHANNPKFQEFLKSRGAESGERSVKQASTSLSKATSSKVAAQKIADMRYKKALQASSERVREMGRRRREGGEGLGGGLDSNKDIVAHVKRYGSIKAGRLGEEKMNEVTKKEAEAVLGGPLKQKPKMPPGKQPAGYRYVRGLARRAMKGQIDAVHRSMEKTMKKEEVEQVVEQNDAMEKKEMAQTQLHFIGYAAKEILEFIDMGGEIEEWYQNKLSKVQSEVESLHSYIEGEKRRTGMVKEEEQIDEKAPPGAKYERMVKHIKKGYSKGGLTDKERSIAYATAWKAHNKANEEVEQIDELDRKTRVSYLKKTLTQLNNIASSRHTTGNKTYGSKTVGKRLAGLSRLERSGAHPASVRDNIDKARARFEEVEQTDEAIRVTMANRQLPPKSKRRVAGGAPTKSDMRRDVAAAAAKEKRSMYGHKGLPMGGINALNVLMPKNVKKGQETWFVGAKKTNEEVEQTDEAIRGYIQSEPGSGDGTAVRRPADQAERDQLAKNLIANRKYNTGKKIGRKSGSVRSNAAGMTPSQKISTALRSPEASKKLDPKEFPYMPKNAKITPFLSKEEVEQVDEVKLNTAVRALGQMKKRADDYYSSPEDKKRVNRFQNTIARKFGEKGAAVADKASSNVGNVERHSNPGDALGRRDQPKITPDSVMQKGGRQGKLRPGVLKDIKRLQKAKLYSLTSKTKPNLPEEVEQIDELKKSTLGSYINKAAHQVRAKSGIAASFETQGTRKRNPENKSAYMDVAKDFRQGAKKRLTGIEKATAKLSKEEVEQVEEKYENNPLHSMPRPNKAVGLKPSQLAKKPAMAAEVAEGSVPTTPKEKELAKHHGDPNRITFGDVIKARLKSVAAKKMGK